MPEDRVKFRGRLPPPKKKLLLTAYIKSCTICRLVPKCMSLSDLRVIIHGLAFIHDISKIYSVLLYSRIVPGVLYLTSSEVWGISCRIRSHCVNCRPTLANMPNLTPASNAGTQLTYPGGMKGWVDLDGWLSTDMVYLSALSPSIIRTPRRVTFWWQPMHYYYAEMLFYLADLQYYCSVTSTVM